MNGIIVDVKEDWVKCTALVFIEINGVTEEYECTLEVINRIVQDCGGQTWMDLKGESIGLVSYLEYFTRIYHN